VREGCSRLRDWQRRGVSSDLRLSVNLGARELTHPALVATVLGAVRSAGIDPSSLCIEVTENTALSDRASSFRALTELSLAGVRVAIDDFGIGYSSLDHLRNLPADVLKIDRSFVRGMSPNSSDTALVAAALALGRAMDLEVVAEGIETEQQASVLRALGCPIGQGRLFARPLPPEELDLLLEAGAPLRH
jgi:EAL domain-containing protein (putative c-di-GMP-specific phosphodiesterase class I)